MHIDHPMVDESRINIDNLELSQEELYKLAKNSCLMVRSWYWTLHSWHDGIGDKGFEHSPMHKLSSEQLKLFLMCPIMHKFIYFNPAHYDNFAAYLGQVSSEGTK